MSAAVSLISEGLIHPRRGEGEKLQWKLVRIGDALELINGRAFKSTEWVKAGLPIVRIQNLNDPSAPFNYYQGHLPARFLLQGGDLLFAWSGTPGTSFGAHIWRGGKAWLNQHIFKVLFDGTVFDKRFLQLAINQNLDNYIRQAHGAAGLAHITKRKFEESELICPPLSEQNRIVADIEKHFTRLDAGVASLKRVQIALKRYRACVLKAACEGRLVPTDAELACREGRSYETAVQLFARIVKERQEKWAGRGKYKSPVPTATKAIRALPDGWCWLTVDAVAFVTKLAGFEYTKFVNYDQHGDLFVLKAENAGRNGFKATEFSRIQSSTVRQLTRSKLLAGDLLMVFVGAGTGNVARVPDDLPYFLGPNIGLIRVTSSQVSPAFLEFYLRSPVGNSLTLSFAKAVAQPSLSMNTIRMIPISLPPFDEQIRIVAEIERRLSLIEGLETAVTANLKRAERLRRSILHSSFTAKI